MLVLTGILVGILFDALRAVCLQFRPGYWWTVVWDLLFWMAAAVVILTGLLLGNWGELRLFVLLVMMLGALLYLSLASYVVLPLMVGTLRLVVRPFRWFRRTVLVPGAGWLRSRLRPPEGEDDEDGEDSEDAANA